MRFGSTFRELIYEHGGGILDDAEIKAIMPAGASSSVIKVTDEVLDTPVDHGSVKDMGSDLGSGSIIVLDETTKLDWVVKKTINFFNHESCGKCTPCREGNYWMKHLTQRVHAGEGDEDQVDLLYDVASNMQGKCLCALGEFATMAVKTGIDRFPEDFAMDDQ